MNQNILSGIVESLTQTVLQNSFTGVFKNIFIPNQVLPDSNILVSSMSYGQGAKTSLNKVVRMAEVSDGIIIKLPAMQAVKVPFSAISSLQMEENGSNLHLHFKFHKAGLGQVNMTIPSEERSQIPYLLQQVGEHEPNLLATNMPEEALETVDNMSELSDWSIPTTDQKTRKTPPPELPLSTGASVSIYFNL